MERIVIDNKKMWESPKLFYKSREDYINPISGNLVWRKGSIYEMLKPGILLGEDNCCMSIEGHEDLFIPATEEEIPTTDSFDKEGIMTFADGSQGRITKIGSKKPEGKLGELLEGKKESSDGELTEFEKALAEIIHHAQGSVLSPEGIAVSNSYALLPIAEKEIRRKIWHDASEEPVEEEFPIIVIDAANCVYLIDKDDTEPFDSEDKWLSVHDILPRKENRL